MSNSQSSFNFRFIVRRTLPTAVAATIVAVPAATAWAQGIPPNAESIGSAALPRDLSPWGMFVSADIVVKAVMVGLAFASVVTWTVWLAKIHRTAGGRGAGHVTPSRRSRRRVRSAKRSSGPARTNGAVAQLLEAATTELQLSSDAVDKDGIKERVASRLERIEAAHGRRIARGTNVLATIGATGPFVGLFGTVWGIMNSFIGISKSHTTSLAVVAPGIAEALARDRVRPRRGHPRGRDLQSVRAHDRRLSRAARRRLGRGVCGW